MGKSSCLSIHVYHTHISHHVHSLLTNFVNQTISKFETYPVFPSDRTVELYRPFLNPSDNLFTRLSLTFRANDDGVVITCSEV